MPQVYVSTVLYDAIIQKGQKPGGFIKKAIEEKLKKEEKDGTGK